MIYFKNINETIKNNVNDSMLDFIGEIEYIWLSETKVQDGDNHSYSYSVNFVLKNTEFSVKFSSAEEARFLIEELAYKNIKCGCVDLDNYN